MAALSPFPVWKEKLPGVEQKELERMFKSKEITDTTTPDNVRKSNEMFMKFSSTVFRAHFRKTKAKLRLCAKLCAVVSDVDAGSSDIPELGSLKCNQLQSVANPPTHINERGSIEFTNAPFWRWVYTDHDKKKEFVCIALSIISGSRDINFAISEDGNQVVVKYNWPTPMFKAVELFDQCKIGGRKVSMDHHKVQSFLSQLLESGVTENSNPQGEITIDLPLTVQRDIGSWKKEAIKVDETKIVLLEFSSFQKSLIIDDADTSIKFE